MISANQASSVTLCYDPTMKAGVKIERKTMVRTIQLTIYKEESHEKVAIFLNESTMYKLFSNASLNKMYIAENGRSRLSTLMINTPGDLVWDLPCMQQASYLEGGPLMWMLPLYLHVNKNPMIMMTMMMMHLHAKNYQNTPSGLKLKNFYCFLSYLEP